MSMLAPDDALARAREIAARSPADETEVTIESIEERFVRFGPGGPTQSADRERVDVAVRVRLSAPDGAPGSSEARATSTSLAPRDIETAIARAIELARACAVDPTRAPLGGPVDVPASAAVPSTCTHGFDEKARWIALALGACAREGLEPAGLAVTHVHTRALANSRGRAVCGARSRAGLALTASSADGSGFAQHIAAGADAIDARVVVDRAIEKALRSRAPRPIEPGEYAVVLEPSAVGALLVFAAIQGFGAQAVLERTSFLCDRVGERVLAEALTVVDDVRRPSLPGIPFDGEGSPTRRVLLVDRGRLVGPVTDRTTAARLSVESSGHALPQPDPDGPRPQHLAVLPGSASLAELIARVRRGLLITDLHYVNLIEPGDLVLTGVTRHGTYWIEDGRVAHAVKNLRFTESLIGALQRIVGVGDGAVAVSSALEGDIVTPALAIDRFRFTSSTDF